MLRKDTVMVLYLSIYQIKITILMILIVAMHCLKLNYTQLSQVLFLGSFLAALDGTVVTTLLTMIAFRFCMSCQTSPWICNCIFIYLQQLFQPIFWVSWSDIFGIRNFVALDCSAVFMELGWCHLVGGCLTHLPRYGF
ncbi:predicted protein, partial [Candida tropicalis MYA-3404]